MYIDSAIIVKLLVKEELSDFFQDALENIVLTTSELSLVEVASALLSKVRTKILILPLDSPVYSKARSLIEFCHPEVSLRTLDAIHMAACDISQDLPLCATDGRMRAAATKLRIPLFPETMPI
jgi:predicted nucleic acid-binding protein